MFYLLLVSILLLYIGLFVFVSETTAAKPAFFTFLKRSRTFSGSQILKFDDVQINEGKASSPNTGKFTAPRSGLYHISCSLIGSFATASISFQN